MENEQYEQYFKPYEERIQNLKVLEAEKTKEINDLRKSINDMIKIISEYKKSTIVTNVPSKTGQNDRPQTSLLPKREESNII